MTEGELHLFVVWPKAKHAEDRIIRDLARETEIVWKGELRFPCGMADAYRRFYGPALPDEKRKLKTCGKGAFTTVVVRDVRPEYGIADENGRVPMRCNVHMNALKLKYRKWAGKGHRVHGTLTTDEFARDVEMLTGRTADEWSAGVPSGTFAPKLPEGWLAVSSLEPFSRGRAMPFRPGPRAATPEDLLADRKPFLFDKYINDVFCDARFNGIDAVEKHSSKAVWSIGNEYRIACRMREAAPDVVPRPLAWLYAADGKGASVVVEKVSGPSLSALLAKGLRESDADSFAGDILVLADALEKTGIVHRDLFEDNFLLSGDGHLKVIDWQLAIDGNLPREDPWVLKNWKFRYVVFGVNRDLPAGEWNDFLAMDAILAKFPQTDRVKEARASIASRAPAMSYRDPPDAATRLKLNLYAVSLLLQMCLRGGKHKKHPQLARRLRTIWKPKKAAARSDA